MSEKVLDSMRVKVGAMDDTYVNNPKSVAGQFSASKAYAAGDYVYYNRKLYRFTAAHAAGAWTGSDASEATVSGELTALKADLNKIDTDLNKIDTDLYTYENIDFTNIETQGAFINASGAIVSTSGTFAYTNTQGIRLLKDDKITLRATGTTLISGITINIHGIRTSKVMYSSSTEEVLEYTADEDEYIILSYNYTFPYTATIERHGIKYAIQTIRTVDSTTDYKIENIPDSRLIDGCVLNGQLLTNSNYRRILINMSEGDIVVFEGGNIDVNIDAISKYDLPNTYTTLAKYSVLNTQEEIKYVAKTDISVIVSTAKIHYGYITIYRKNGYGLVEKFVHNRYHSKNGYYNKNTEEIDDTNLFIYKEVNVNPPSDKYFKYSCTIEQSYTPISVIVFIDENNNMISDVIPYSTGGSYSGVAEIPINATKVIITMRSINYSYQFAILHKHFGNSYDTIKDMISAKATGESRVGGYLFRNIVSSPEMKYQTQDSYEYPYFDINSSIEQYQSINAEIMRTQTDIFNKLPSEEIDFTPANGYTRVIVGKNSEDVFFVAHYASNRTGSYGSTVLNRLEITNDFVNFTTVFKGDDNTSDTGASIEGMKHLEVLSVKEFADGSYLVVAKVIYTGYQDIITVFCKLSSDMTTIELLEYTDLDGYVVNMIDEFHSGVYDWSVDIQGSKCICTTYGTRQPDTDYGRVWYTEDNGNTWKQVFQTNTHYSDGIDEGDEIPTTTHTHGVMLDPYSNRMFVIAGEDNRNIFWNDNGINANNNNWNVIKIRKDLIFNQQTSTQVVNGYAFEDSLVFGSDNGNIGGFYRLNKLDNGEYSNIEIAHEILPNKYRGVLYCAAEIFRRDNYTPVFLCITRENAMLTEEQNEQFMQNNLARVIATYDGVNFVEVWKDDTYGSHTVMIDGVSTTRNFAYCTRGMQCYLLKNGDIIIKYSGRDYTYFGGNPLYSVVGYSDISSRVKRIKNAERQL